jgi:nucleotide-binding universal stress UspA family protein
MGIGPGISTFANLRAARAHAHEVRQAVAATHERVAADLEGAGLAVERRMVPGKPERAVLAEAEAFGADLIVVGARRQGTLAATLLGSVSRSVVERASCSVLVARSTSARRLILAIDDSPPARFATMIVGTWPLFAGGRILLVGVGDAAPSAIRSDGERPAALHATTTDATDEPVSALQEAAAELTARGRQVQSDVRGGDVGTEAVAAAREWQADMVVVGSDPQPLLRRLVLGSVARRVLDGVTSSVFIARQAARTDGSSVPDGEQG